MYTDLLFVNQLIISYLYKTKLFSSGSLTVIPPLSFTVCLFILTSPKRGVSSNLTFFGNHVAISVVAFLLNSLNTNRKPSFYV